MNFTSQEDFIFIHNVSSIYPEHITKIIIDEESE